MAELIALWNVLPNCVKIPALVILAWIIIAKVVVGISAGGTELTEEEATRGAGIIMAPAIIGLVAVFEAEKKLNKLAKIHNYPFAKDEDDIEIL
jgi:uncharacterized spore protein YtfJ